MAILRAESTAPHMSAAPARTRFSPADAPGAALTCMWPCKGMRSSASLVTLNPYVFHLGLLLVFADNAPYVVLIARLTGLGWEVLPYGVMCLAAAATIVSLLISLFLADRPGA